MKFTIRQLEIFREVAKSGHVTNSADILGISQSAISMALQELESNLQTKLFERRNKKLILNENGRLLLENGGEILKHAEELEHLFSQSRIGGKLKIGASQTIGDYIMPQLIYDFMQRYPYVSCELVVDNTKTVIEKIETGDVDIGFVEGIINSTQTHNTEWREDELIVVASSTTKLRKQEYRLSELAHEKWVLREEGSGTRAIFEQAVTQSKTTIDVYLTLGHNEAIKRIVSSTDAISCLSRLVVQTELETNKLIELPLKPRPLKRKLFRVTHTDKYMGKLLHTFIEHCDTFKG